MFTQHTNAINQETKSNAVQFYTGPELSKLVAICPTHSKLTEILGDSDRASKFDSDYAMTDSNYNGRVRPITIWLQDVKENIRPLVFTMELSSELKLASTGSKKIINDYGQSTWSKTGVSGVVENPKMAWFSQTGIREARIGEEEYYNFMKQIVRPDESKVTIVELLTSEKLDFQSVVEGNLNGLRNFAEWAIKNQMYFVPVYAVKESTSDDGSTRNRQTIINRLEAFMSCVPDEEGNVKSKDKTRFAAQIIRNKADYEEGGRNFSNAYYTAEFQEYVKEDCLNVESAPAETASNSKAGTSWI